MVGQCFYGFSDLNPCDDPDKFGSFLPDDADDAVTDWLESLVAAPGQVSVYVVFRSAFQI